MTKTPKENWSALKATYGTHTSLNLWVDYQKYTMTNFSSNTPLTQQINQMSELKNWIVAAGLNISDPLHTLNVLQALPTSYKIVQQTILATISNFTMINWADIQSCILSEELWQVSQPMSVLFMLNHLTTKINATIVEAMDTGKETAVARHVSSLEKWHSLRGRDPTRSRDEKGRKKKRKKRTFPWALSSWMTSLTCLIVLALYLSLNLMTWFASILHVNITGCSTPVALIISQMISLISQNINHFLLHAKHTLPTRPPISLILASALSQEEPGSMVKRRQSSSMMYSTPWRSEGDFSWYSKLTERDLLQPFPVHVPQLAKMVQHMPKVISKVNIMDHNMHKHTFHSCYPYHDGHRDTTGVAWSPLLVCSTTTNK